MVRGGSGAAAPIARNRVRTGGRGVAAAVRERWAGARRGSMRRSRREGLCRGGFELGAG